MGNWGYNPTYRVYNPVDYPVYKLVFVRALVQKNSPFWWVSTIMEIRRKYTLCQSCWFASEFHQDFLQ